MKNYSLSFRWNVNNSLQILIFIFLVLTVADLYAQQSDDEGLPEFDCIIEPGYVVDVGVAVPGVIKDMFVDMGDFVEKGMPLARLDYSVEQASLELARARAASKASIEQFKQQAEFTRRHRARNQELHDKSMISDQEIDRLETEQRVAQLKLRQANEQLRIAELDYKRSMEMLKRRTVSSPIKGVVMERFKSAGEYVADAPVMRLAQLDPLHVEIIAPVDYIGRIPVGMKAEIYVTVPGFDVQTATVERVDWVADTASGTFGIRLVLPNPEYKIPGGLRCRLKFLADQIANKEDDKQNDTVLVVKPSEKAVDAKPIIEGPSTEELDEVGFVEDAYSRSEGEKDHRFEHESECKKNHPWAISDDRCMDQLSDVPQAESDKLEDVEQAEAPTNSEDINQSKVELEPFQYISHEIGFVHTKGPQCYVIGPISQEDTVYKLTKHLKNHIQKITVREEEHSTVADYFLFSKAQEDRRAVKELMNKFRDAGITDMVEMGSRGAYAFKVALGAYKKQRNAERRRTALQELGFEVEVTARSKINTDFWLDLSLESNADQSDKLSGLVGNVGYSYVVNSIDCTSLLARK